MSTKICDTFDTCDTCEYWNRDDDNIILLCHACTNQKSDWFGYETEGDFRCEHWE